MPRLFIVSFLLALLLVSCNQAQDIPVSPTREMPTQTEVIEQTQTPKPEHTPTFTQKPTEKTLVPTKEVMFTPSPEVPTDNPCSNKYYLERLDHRRGFVGNIYLWDPYPYSYKVFNPGIGMTSLFKLYPNETNIPGPSHQGFAPAFSTHHQQIAYMVTNEAGFVGVWVADLNLCQAERIWEDTEQWLGDASEHLWTGEASITWGPSDNTLIILSNVNRPHLAVYSFTSEELYMWSGDCSQIAKNSETGQWITTCSFNKDGDTNYAILDTDGSIQLLSSSPDNDLISVIDWAFSPDQRQVVFAAEDYALFVANNENTIQLPIHWDEEIIKNHLHFDTKQRVFQWSTDGANILVFGYENSGKLCPPGISVITGESYEQPCWLLVDAQNGEIVWWLKQDIVEQILPWEGIYTYNEAALSPDNQWIAMFVMHAPIREAILVSVETDQIIEIGNFEVTKVFWGNE